LAIEAASGVLLLVVASLAMIWANSPLSDVYRAIWHTPIGFSIGSWSFERDLHFWINDVLMTVFFFVVGLEIRREIHHGELSELRRAALPIVAALGGMIAPALIYTAFNYGRPTLVGWGVPMATDIAFAVGVLVLLGRVLPAMRILLLALAVIDDVGAIVVIALFYSGQMSAAGFLLAGAGVLGIVGLQLFGARSPWAYVVPSLVMWAGALEAGIHPTLVGVIVGMMTPVRAWLGVGHFLARAEQSIGGARERGTLEEPALLPLLDDLNVSRREAVAPVHRLQHVLHGWVAFVIMPLFALANAGVPLGSATLEGDGVNVFLGIALGLVVGKPLGITALSWLLQRAGMVALPGGIGWSQVALVGAVGGIGFTMSLFVAQLAFEPGPMLETAKLAIICGSVGAALVSAAGGRLVLPVSAALGAARSEGEAEATTER
jgi:NhaA family Na+:H+ antiporter